MRVLQIAHSHPRFHPGGTELVALGLHHQALAEGLDSWYLGAVDASQTEPHPGTRIIALSDDHRESALFVSGFNTFRLEQADWDGFHADFERYLTLIRPDVVHFHHVINFGLEAIHTVRHVLPDARIVLTIHDYYLICANRGQLYKRPTKQRCDGPSLDACTKCLPEATLNAFAMRRDDVRNTLDRCDAIFSPSVFLKDKMQRHLGIRHEIVCVENGYVGVDPPSSAKSRNGDEPFVFGYLGNIVDVKGLADLLDAAEILQAAGYDNFRVHVHGAQLIDDDHLRQRMEAAQDTLADSVTFFGGYRAADAGRLMADIDCLVFPSLWWENAPLVVCEALHHARQVIAYPHNAAVEILNRYGVGRIAKASHPKALAQEMRMLLDEPRLAQCAPTAPIPQRKDLLARYLARYAAL